MGSQPNISIGQWREPGGRREVSASYECDRTNEEKCLIVAVTESDSDGDVWLCQGLGLFVFEDSEECS
jgi:hypothetical protein